MVYLFPRLDPPLDPVWQQDQPGCCLLPQWLVWSRSWRCAWFGLEPTLMTGEELGSFCLQQRSKQLLLRARVCTFIFTRCNSASHGVTVDVYLLLWIVMLFVQILCLHQSMDVSVTVLWTCLRSKVLLCCCLGDLSSASVPVSIDARSKLPVCVAECLIFAQCTVHQTVWVLVILVTFLHPWWLRSGWREVTIVGVRVFPVWHRNESVVCEGLFNHLVRSLNSVYKW